MFWNKNRHKEGDYRIEERFVPESNTTVYKLQRYGVYCGYDDFGYEWHTKQVCASLEDAVKMAERYRKADNVKYYAV